MLGPPMSISSTSAPKAMSGFAAAFTNGYRLTTTRSIGVMSCCAQRRHVVGAVAAGEDAAVDRRVQRLDAAVHDFGKAGHAEMPVTGTPACSSARAVPPVDTSSNPRAARACANGKEAGLVGNAQQGSGHMWIPTELTEP